MSSIQVLQQPPPNRAYRKHPCILCAQRKVKCDRNEPCKNCTRMGVECVSAATPLPRKIKRRFPEAELLSRIKRYEHHLKGYGADLDAINSEVSRREIVPVPDSTRIKSSHPISPVAVSPEHSFRSLSIRRSLRHFENNLNLGVDDQFRDAEELLEVSSDEEVFAKPIIKTSNEPNGVRADILLGFQTTDNLKALHPSPIHIFRLWQTFLDNVNPLTKILHAPSVQQKVLDAAANLDDVPKNTEALMFGIYAAATISMSDNECQKRFNEDREDVMARFQSGARQALQNVGYLRSTDIVVLQAFILYLLSSMQMTMDPQTMFCLIGVAVRIAQRIGLNTDGTSFAIPPFEVEMRRRLWWQIVLIDMRVSEISGSGMSTHLYTWNTKLPSNVNDSDLFPDMRDPPVERRGLTDMMYIRIRCEAVQFLQQSRELTRVFGVKDDVIKEFQDRLEREYLRDCDPLIPLHVISTMTARTAICQLRIGRDHHSFISDFTNRLSQLEKEQMFQLSLEMIESHNAVMKNPSVQRFIWHIYTNFPGAAHVYLFYELRYRKPDELADRAWQELSESAESRMKYDGQHFFDSHFFLKKKHSLIHYALGNMTVKAWEAREAAFRNCSRASPPVPRFVLLLRKQLAEKRIAKSSRLDDSTSSVSVDQLFGGQLSSQYQILDPNPLSIGLAFNQSMLPMYPNDMPPTGWEFWNGMIQGGDSMQGIDGTSPPYNYFRN